MHAFQIIQVLYISKTITRNKNLDTSQAVTFHSFIPLARAECDDSSPFQDLHPFLSVTYFFLPPFHSQELLPFLSVMYFFLPPFHSQELLPFLSVMYFFMPPFHSQELLPFLSVMYFSLPPFSTNYSSILSHLILPFISWSTSQSCCPIFIYNTRLWILFHSTLCTFPNQRNVFNLIVYIIVGFLTLALISLLVNILQFSFSLPYTGPKILLYTFLSKMFNCFLYISLLVSHFLMHMLTFCLLLFYLVLILVFC